MINLYINERSVGDVTILDLKGRERIHGVTVALHKSIHCLADEEKVQILVDLVSVKHDDELKAVASFERKTLRIVERQRFLM